MVDAILAAVRRRRPQVKAEHREDIPSDLLERIKAEATRAERNRAMGAQSPRQSFPIAQVTMPGARIIAVRDESGQTRDVAWSEYRKELKRPRANTALSGRTLRLRSKPRRRGC